jgi:hypothetical protein
LTRTEKIVGVLLAIIASVGLGYALSKMSFFASFMSMFFALVVLIVAVLISVYDFIKGEFYSRYFWVAFAGLVFAQLLSGQFENYEREQMKAQAEIVVKAIDKLYVKNNFLPDSLEQIEFPLKVQVFAYEEVYFYVTDTAKRNYSISYDIQDEWHEYVYDSESKQWYLED